jgi:Icc-related predicted phosphoesterase
MLENYMDNKIKVAAMSDLHGYLPNDVPECDVVCIAGDILPLDVQSDLIKSVSWFLLDFYPWAESLPCDKVIFVAGNHDFMFQWIGTDKGYSGSEVMKKLFNIHKKDTKLVYLQDSSYEYKGKRFYGSPWVADLTNWAFYRNDDELRMIWSMLPKKCDVLITHMPPRTGNYGTVLEAGWNNGKNFGSQILAEEVSWRDIKYHVFGHVHSGQHSDGVICGTTMANVSLKNEDYKVKYHIYEFEV